MNTSEHCRQCCRQMSTYKSENSLQQRTLSGTVCGVVVLNNACLDGFVACLKNTRSPDRPRSLAPASESPKRALFCFIRNGFVVVSVVVCTLRTIFSLFGAVLDIERIIDASLCLYYCERMR